LGFFMFMALIFNQDTINQIDWRWTN